jgi:hypothetical protein
MPQNSDRQKSLEFGLNHLKMSKLHACSILIPNVLFWLIARKQREDLRVGVVLAGSNDEMQCSSSRAPRF